MICTVHHIYQGVRSRGNMKDRQLTRIRYYNYGRIILKWTLKNWIVGQGLDCVCVAGWMVGWLVG